MTEQDKKWSSYGFRILLSTVSHPFEYAKVLIQIGYEPIPPRPSTTFFGKPALKLPNIFEYVKHIKTVDGFSGCYRGLESKVCGSLLSAIATQKVTDYLDLCRNGEEEEDEDVEIARYKRYTGVFESVCIRKYMVPTTVIIYCFLSSSRNTLPKYPQGRVRKKFLRTVRNDILIRATTIVVSQPFHVITVRMMAQFVGRELRYRGIFGSIGEIYTQNGILGFFSGLIPRLLGDILTVLMANTLTYVINTYVVEEKELQVYTSATMMFIATAVTYPFQVVSNCMAVTRSGIMAGSPPLMPHYGTWVECWTDLSSRNQLKRGSSLIMRYYVGPHLPTRNEIITKIPVLKY